jgi:hypothetical protein
MRSRVGRSYLPYLSINTLKFQSHTYLTLAYIFDANTKLKYMILSKKSLNI